MIRIQNIEVRLRPKTAEYVAETGFGQTDLSGVFLRVSDFLSGDNPWGLHQDFAFSDTLSSVRQAEILDKAARNPINEYIEISHDLHAKLLRILSDPDPSLGRIPPFLAREVLPIYNAIERAVK